MERAGRFRRQIVRGRYSLVVVVALAASMVAVTAGPAPATYPGKNGRIAVVGDDGDFEIYTMNPNGTNPIKLTDNTFCDRDPKFSGDGKKIVYWTHPCPEFLPDEWEIWLMDADGSNKVQLTDNDVTDSDPAISADGTRIVFVRENDLWIMNADGSGQTQLTEHPAGTPVSYDVADFDPTFSPDGTKIAFSRLFALNGEVLTNEITIMDADGSNEAQLTYLDDFVLGNQPNFSPDGSKIVWRRAPIEEIGGGEIWVMNAVEGTDQHAITNDGYDDFDPIFSPDGTKIVYLSYRVPLANGSTGPVMVMMNPDGSNQVPSSGVSSDKVPSDWGVSTAPTVTVLSPTNQTYVAKSIVLADYTCVDDDDREPLCRGTVPNGASIDTSTVGEKVFVVESSDSEGNIADPVTVTYRVGYDIRLLFPVAAPPRVNIGIAGLPSIVRFQLTDANGAHASSLSAVHAVTYERTSCSAFTVDPAAGTPASPPVPSGLLYSRLTRFAYLWRTPGVSGCYTLFLELDSGQVVHAFYRLL